MVAIKELLINKNIYQIRMFISKSKDDYVGKSISLLQRETEFEIGCFREVGWCRQSLADNT